MKRLGILIALALGASLVLAGPVLAAAPSNDTFGGATVVSPGFSESLDTTEATTDADDAEANVADCGAPATDASVWYSLTAATDGGAFVDVSASDYSAGVIVVTGTPGSFAFVGCAQGGVAFGTVAGETYSILAFDDQLDGSGNGGTLEISIGDIPPPPVVDVTVDPVGHFQSKTGMATISGTVTCTGGTDFAGIEVSLRQSVGRFIVSGFGSTEFACDGTTQAWSVDVFPDNGTFKGGRTASVTIAFACGPFDCSEDVEETTVKLRK